MVSVYASVNMLYHLYCKGPVLEVHSKVNLNVHFFVMCIFFMFLISDLPTKYVFNSLFISSNPGANPFDKICPPTCVNARQKPLEEPLLIV